MSEHFEDETVGRRHWAIAEGYLVEDIDELETLGNQHETLFLLNAGDVPAQVAISIYYPDREPLGPYRYEVAPRRTLQVALEDLDAPRIPRGEEFQTLIESNQAIVVLATRRRVPHPEDSPLCRISMAG